MARSQGSLEYLVIIAAVIAVAAIVTIIVVNYAGSGAKQYSFNACKEASAACKLTHASVPLDNCTQCEAACKNPDGTELFENAVDCCRIGYLQGIYEGSTECNGKCLFDSECNQDNNELCCNNICKPIDCKTSGDCFFNARTDPCISQINCLSAGTCSASCDYANPILKPGCCSPNSDPEVNCPTGQFCCLTYKGGRHSQAYGVCCNSATQYCSSDLMGCVDYVCLKDDDCKDKVTLETCQKPVCNNPGTPSASCGVTNIPNCECDTTADCVAKLGDHYICENRQCNYVKCFDISDCHAPDPCHSVVCNNPGTSSSYCSWPELPDGTSCGETYTYFKCEIIGGKPGSCVYSASYTCSDGVCIRTDKVGRCWACTQSSTYPDCSLCDASTGTCYFYVCKTPKGYYCVHDCADCNGACGSL